MVHTIALNLTWEKLLLGMVLMKKCFSQKKGNYLSSNWRHCSCFYPNLKQMTLTKTNVSNSFNYGPY